MATPFASNHFVRRATLLALVSLLGVCTHCAADWPHKLHRGPFRLHADFPIGRYDYLFTQLVDLDAQISRTLQLAKPSDPIDVYLFRDQDGSLYLYYVGGGEKAIGVARLRPKSDQ